MGAASFFDNNGRICYVYSLGDTAQWSSDADRLDALVAALQTPELTAAVMDDTQRITVGTGVERA